MEITDFCRDLIMQAYHGFNNYVYKATTSDGTEIQVESRVKDNEDFKYRKVFIDRPMRLVYDNPQKPDEDVKLSASDRTVVDAFVDAYRIYFNGQRMQKTKIKAGLKVTKAQIKKIRQLLGIKDENAEVIYEDPFNLSERTYVWDPDLADSEIIPWKEDQEDYLTTNVAPYAADYRVDESKTRIGYEIPFTREFYRYTPLKPSADIFKELQELEIQEKDLMDKILH